MSNLLSRLAERAVGEGRAATPRLRAPFEEPRAADAVGAPEPFDGMSAPTKSAPVRRPGPLLATAPPRRLAPTSVPVVGETVSREKPTQVEPPAADLLATVDRLLAPVPAETPAVEEPVGVPAEALPGAEMPDAPLLPPAPAVPVAVAIPAAPPEHAVHAPVAPAAAREEPQTVRVHIGRLEVRANLLPPPPPSRPRAEAPRRRDELTLTEYLRGRR